MTTVILVLIATSAFLGCTYASVTTIPQHVAGVGHVYRYQGRANFPYQLAEGEKLIREFCLKKGGTPRIVSHRQRYVGDIDLSDAVATTTSSVTGSVMGGMINAYASRRPRSRARTRRSET